MNDVTRWLQDADPLAFEPPPGDAEVARMRRHVLGSRESRCRAARFSPGLALGTAGILLIAAATLHQTRDAPPEAVTHVTGSEATPARMAQPAVPRAGVRQIYFTAPGGTRVIWLLERGNEREATP